jgi:hypothetical protein
MPLPKPKRDPEANGPQDWTEHTAAQNTLRALAGQAAKTSAHMRKAKP